MNNFFKSHAFKAILVLIISFLLLIPVSLVKSKIRERQSTKDITVAEIQDKWGNPQVFSGPFLEIPYEKYNDEKKKTYLGKITLLPETLNVNSEVETLVRSRSIYDAIVYNSTTKISGSFNLNELNVKSISQEDIRKDLAKLVYYISDSRGIEKISEIDVDKQKLKFKPYGSGNKSRYDEEAQSGFETDIDIVSKQNISFDFELDLRGSSEISFIPVGKETNVNVTSDWGDPSFMGAFLPNKREINEDGFTAEWQVSYFNRSFAQVIIDKSFEGSKSLFSVSFIQIMDEYQKNFRTVKYAYIVILLTFTVFIMMEVLSGSNLNVIHYLLTGFSLVIFYLLVLSLSEFFTFSTSYTFASLAVIMQTFLYSRSFLIRKLSILFSGLMGLLYLYLFILLQLEALALLVGSLGIFLILSIVMYLSRKIDWSN